MEWFVYASAFVLLLVLDFIWMRGRITVVKSLTACAFYVVVAMAFAFYVWHLKGGTAASEYVTIFWLEKMLSVDNLLVISLIFGFYNIADRHQHTALLYGILGAVFFRTIFVFAGAALLEQFTWLLYGFALFLIWTGCKIMRGGDDEMFRPQDAWIVRFLDRRFGTGARFFCAIVTIEVCDIMFAVDSIPASFGVSRDAFVILSANLFAVLGLRSLYHAVSYGLKIFRGMEPWIGAALVALGLEVFAGHIFHIPGWATMLVTMGIIAGGVIYNWRAGKIA